MQPHKIFYIGFYDYPKNLDELISFPAANAKIDYVISLLSRLNYYIYFISLCAPRKGFFWMGSSRNLSKNNTVRFLPSFGQSNKLTSHLNFWLKKIFLFFHLIFLVKPNDIVLVYHSLAYADVVFFARKIRKFKLVLQIEEIYQDVVKCSESKKKFEYKVFSVADKYIFPTQLLDKKINKLKHPSIILHGTYSTYKSNLSKFNDGRVHAIYAGTFDPKKGVFSVIKSALHLDSRIHLHILGFGKPSDIEAVKNMIQEVSKKSEAIVSYDGLLTGDDYSIFISKCHIGLSTQNTDAKFNDTSFPSKILSYMAHGLRVVSIRIPAIEASSVSDSITYIQNNKPEDIATGIMSCNLITSNDPRKMIDKLDKKALTQLSNILNG